MSLPPKNNEEIVAKLEWTPEQLKIITNTIAKGATPEELQLFLYRCKSMNLNPLKPGEVFFIKYANNPGTVVIGIEGFRKRAARTGKHCGTKRGILRDEKGNAFGAWAEVYRTDWTHPAREEVSIKEYSTGRGQWQKMPETMIKKVAEVAALRMAFPEDLGGLYSHDETEQSQPETNKPPPPPHKQAPQPRQVGSLQKPEYRFGPGFGENKGKTLSDVSLDWLAKQITRAMDKKASGANIGEEGEDFLSAATRFMETQGK